MVLYLYSVTYEGVTALVDNSRMLTTLNVFPCGRIIEEKQGKLVKISKFPHRQLFKSGSFKISDTISKTLIT